MPEAAGVPPSATRRLLHRWFVEYNPLYVLSAALVLGGMILSSRGLAHDGSLYGQIGIAAIAELYSAALIGGAALLLRVGQRRSAVMLALLTVLYQCDLTLHTETCPNLGAIGLLATGGWIGVFVLKLLALCRAMKLRLSRAALAAATLGGVGLAILPYLFARMDPRLAGAVVALWLFALVTLQRMGTVTSLVLLDDWGQTVLRRAARATWVLWGLLLSLHLVFWSTQYRLALAPIAVVTPLFLASTIRSETRVWCVVVATLVLVALVAPASFSVAALLASAGLGLRAKAGHRLLTAVAVDARAAGVTPYRVAGDDAREVSPPVLGAASEVDPGPMVRRLLTGAVLSVYLAMWTVSWTGGPWPPHVVGLDVLLSVVLLLGAWKLRARVALAPLAAGWVHFAVHAELVPAPRSLLGWGATSIGLGFGLLVVSLAASFWLRPRSREVGTS